MIIFPNLEKTFLITFFSFSSRSGGMTGTLSTTIMQSVPLTSTGFSLRRSPKSSEKKSVNPMDHFRNQLSLYFKLCLSASLL